MNNIIEMEDRPIDMCPTGYDYEQYQLSELVNESMKLKKQLEIATKALKKYMTFCRHPAEEALKEMEGVK